MLAVNRANPVQSLTPEQIMQIFDADLTNWSEVGGPDDSILVFRLDDITSYATEQELGADLSRAPQCLSRIVADHPNMIAYLPEQYVAPDFAGKVLDEGRITPASFFAGRQWYPTAAPAPQYGPDSAAGRHAVGQSGGHPDRIAAGAFRRHLHGRAGRLAAAPDAETRDRAAGRHSVGRLRILRARRGRAAGTRRLRPAGRARRHSPAA